MNIACPVPGEPQTNIRGELFAIVRALESDRRPLEICTDSEWAIERIRDRALVADVEGEGIVLGA